MELSTLILRMYINDLESFTFNTETKLKILY